MLDYGPGDVPTDHRWLDEAYVADWSARANEAPHRDAILAAFVDELRRFGDESDLGVLELGSGPGYLAERICSRVRVARYVAVDISPPMRLLAAARLASCAPKVDLVEADFRTPGWELGIGHDFDAVVSLQAVHELRRAERIPALYAAALTRLRPGGIVLIADLVNRPDEEPRAHQLSVDGHLGALHQSGFVQARCVGEVDPVALLVAERARA